ncbi:MAG: ribose transport system permease protein [Actinomycetota bacterium]|nr:ribose transport system permease protein [Actinomycetota bacterium]
MAKVATANAPQAVSLDAVTGGGRRGAKKAALTIVGKYGTLIALGLMVVMFSVEARSSFLTVQNFLNILDEASLTAIIAGGLTIGAIAGEFDLSIGYTASFAGVLVTGLITRSGMSIALAIVIAILAGALVGVTNGLVVAKAGVNSIVGTLGVGTILVGISYGYSQGIPISNGLTTHFLNLAGGKFHGMPNDIFYMAVVLGILVLLVAKTELGQRMIAVGGNKEAARLSGIRTDRIKIAAFIIMGTAAAITGVLLASLTGSGTIGAGDGYLLSAFAAVYLGSATLRDGEFHILGTFIGVMIIAVGFNGLGIFGLPTYYQYIFNGGVLVAAVGLSTIARRAAAR